MLGFDDLDRATLQELREFALVCQESAVAVRKTVSRTRGLKTRVRVLRLFAFRDPTKTELRAKLPGIAHDDFYRQARDRLPVPLSQLSRRLVEVPEGASWLVQAETRIAGRKRRREQRTTSLQAELAARGLPFVAEHWAVRNFCAGKDRTTARAVDHMQREHRTRLVRAHVHERERGAGLVPFEHRNAELHGLAVHVGVALTYHELALGSVLLFQGMSAAHALACLLVRQGRCDSLDQVLLDRLVLAAGELMVTGTPEVRAWLCAARELALSWPGTWSSGMIRGL